MQDIPVNEPADDVSELLLPRPDLTPPWVPQTDEPVSCHLATGEQNVLFGTGYGYSAGALGDKLEELGGIDVVIAEHGDTDHYGAAVTLRERFSDVTLAMPDKDADMLKKPYYDEEADVRLEDGDERFGVESIHMPGHTPGNMSFIDEERNALFVGDSFAHKSSDVSEPGDWSGEFAPIDAGHQKMSHEKACESLLILRDYSFDTAYLTHGPDVLEGAQDEVETLIDDLDL